MLAAGAAKKSQAELLAGLIKRKSTDGPEAKRPRPDSAPVVAAPVAPPPAPAPARRHVVAKGDTLQSISLRYYGTRSRFRDIYAANRDIMPNEGTLRIGMELKIP